VATFYILPPRPLLGQQIIQFLQSWLPGLNWATLNKAELAEMVTAKACCQQDIYVVFREDLPEGVEVPRALQDDFGAAPGDEIVEVAMGNVKRWKLAA
jgi:hypothetical protein